MLTLELTSRQADFQREIHEVMLRCFRPFALQADEMADIPVGFLEQTEIRRLRSFLSGHDEAFTRGRESLLDARDAETRFLMQEEAGYGDAPLFVSFPGLGLAAPMMKASATEEQKERFVLPFADPDICRWAAFAMTEPGAGSDVMAIALSAHKDGSHHVLNGQKWFIGNGVRADWVLVFATTNQRLGPFGIKAFVVERGTAGFEARLMPGTLGFRALQLSELSFRECRIPGSNLISWPNHRRGFDSAMSTFQQFRPAIAALAVGAGRAMLDHAAGAARQNGCTHSSALAWQKLHKRLEFLRIRLHGARLLAWKAARMASAGLDNLAQVCMAKVCCARAAMESCSFCSEVACATGDPFDSWVDKWFRDCKAFELMEGTSDIQRLMLTRTLLKSA